MLIQWVSEKHRSNPKPGHPTGGADKVGHGAAGPGEARRVGAGRGGRSRAGAGRGGAERFGQLTTFHFDFQGDEDNRPGRLFGSTDASNPLQTESGNTIIG